MNLGFLTALQDLPVQEDSRLEKALAELLLLHLLDHPPDRKEGARQFQLHQPAGEAGQSANH
jgi:hypothetical protein